MAASHLREDVLADGLEEELVVPGRYGDDMVQGLVSALDFMRIKTDPGRDGRPWAPRCCVLRATEELSNSWLRADAGLSVLPLAPDPEGRRQDAARVGVSRGGEDPGPRSEWITCSNTVVLEVSLLSDHLHEAHVLLIPVLDPS